MSIARHPNKICSHSTSFEWFKRTTPEKREVTTESASKSSGRDLPSARDSPIWAALTWPLLLLRDRVHARVRTRAHGLLRRGSARLLRAGRSLSIPWQCRPKRTQGTAIEQSITES